MHDLLATTRLVCCRVPGVSADDAAGVSGTRRHTSLHWSGSGTSVEVEAFLVKWGSIGAWLLELSFESLLRGELGSHLSRVVLSWKSN